MNLPSPISPRTRCAPNIARLALAAGALVVLLAASPAGASPYGTVVRTNASTLPHPHYYTLDEPEDRALGGRRPNVSAHAEPNAHSKVITTLNTVTGDGTQNLVLILDGVDLSSSTTWYHVRPAILPNNSTGWVPRSALGTLYTVNTHLYINRETETAVLTKDGKPIFTTRVGVGRPYWPTPRGQFYVRDKLTDFHNAFYGPLASGTSARSATLTDWPGGGFIGIHGTNEPSLVPGTSRTVASGS